MIGATEIGVVVILVVILFGAKRLPEVGRSLGEGIREFKKSTHGMMDEESDKDKSEKPRS